MKHIGIIGAGISGLAAAKVFTEAGYRVTVFEKSSGIGGVWEKARSYTGVTTQTTRDEYAFSDFPMPRQYPMWPTGSQVQEYLESYAGHFRIREHIRFQTEVEEMQFDGGEWRVRTRDLQTGAKQYHFFYFVAVCTGTFHQPYIPALPGMDTFQALGGKVLHSSGVTSDKDLEGKDVAVVGFAKSATDLATRAASVSKSSTLLYRQAQWKVPRFFGNKINMKYLLFSRFSEAFFSAPKKSLFERLLHSAGKPLVWMQWRGLELLLNKQFKLKECGMVPRHRIEDQISCSLGVEPVGFYESVRQKKIRAVCSELSHFEGRKLVLKNGESIQPDLVVFGTGFRQHLPFLKGYESRLKDKDGIFRLHRNILNPAVPQLGFVGFNSSFFSTLTSEIAAHWLVAYLDGAISRPTPEVLQQELEETSRWRKVGRPVAGEFSGLCVAPFNFGHLDQLMRDMGLRTMASRFLLYEFFKPINPKDYARLLLARKKETAGRTKVTPMEVKKDKVKERQPVEWGKV